MKFGIGILGILLVSCVKDFPDVQTEVLGHAGESLFTSKSKYPPNTIQSVQEAIQQGADGVEVDVQMTQDGFLVAFHEEKLDEVSTGSGCVNDQTFAQLQSIQVYKSDYTINPLNVIIEYVLGQGKKLFLDIKHFNVCQGHGISFSQFNVALNLILAPYSDAQKDLVYVNSRNYELLNALSDTVIHKAYEYDDFTNALPVILSNHFEMLTFKLPLMTNEINQTLLANNIGLAIFNVKSKTDINKALHYNPDFVISDNIKPTLKAIHGK